MKKMAAIKPMYQISNLQDIEQQRVVLLKQLHKQEKQVNRDFDRVTVSWKRWTSFGSIVSNVASFLLPNIGLLSTGKSLLNRLFKK